MRPRHYIIAGSFAVVVLCVFTFGRSGTSIPRSLEPIIQSAPSFAGGGAGPDSSHRDPARRQPKPAPGGSHPVWHLIGNAEREHEAVKTRQSRTLKEAVAEYRRRYGLPPPPNFDKWWEFAKRKNVQLVDEFDTVFEVITPFWGLRPATIRQRAVEACGFDNALMAVQIRKGNVTNINDGNDWLRQAVPAMMESFMQYLPDMDLAFNIHDEPRVIVPHEDMVKLVDLARRVNMPAANAAKKPRNSFTKHVKGLSDGSHLPETKLTRFNMFAHQPTWTHSRMSCPPDSPARELEETDRLDEIGAYALGELGFVYNVTAMTDICLTPSLSETHGFFDRPNAFNIVHDLFPIFSQSKLSSYADILFPSPWYWSDRVPYEEEKDMPWAAKKDRLYWRGSTTGGYSRNGGWRRQHRQRFVQKINAADQAKILVNRAGEDGGQDQEWRVKEVPRGDYEEIIDVYFSHLGQCDNGDCIAQREFFNIKDHVEQWEAWQYKHLLDIDGNAFSGRFYAFLKSRSLVYKWAVFREWHQEWLKPWAHYIPLSLRGDDWLETVRFFGDGALGKREAERLAMQGRDWANKALREEDLEVWFFRLLLEYGRVIDDDREKIGFDG
ncbi:hypothetical protein P8C59_000664 [Phyllachora maydis]|uniref:Glycosyl transferase CAP10 domain-containing protein n=1 Tax=Phyllachora maydis TaxID=1825666 RepID=A0AAD9M6S0_9PEZI|nr:hypothetical protein P8C59_000664 [Phyllachora maydis]